MTVTEGIFEAVRLTERTFTTSSKHRQGCIRKTALNFIGFLRKQGYQRITLNEAQELFSYVVDRWDQKTIKAYFGVREGFSEQVIERTARYATGTVSMKKILLKRQIKERSGYLQKLGLCSFQKVGKLDHSTWFMVLNDVSLVPELVRMSIPTGEASLQAQSSCVNFSLPSTHSEDMSALTLPVRDDDSHTPPTIGGERKSLDFSIPTQQLSPLEQTIFSAKPSTEPDRTKIQWPRSSKDPGG